MRRTNRKLLNGALLALLALAPACTCPQTGGRGGRTSQDVASAAGAFAFFGGLMGLVANVPAESNVRACCEADLTVKPSVPQQVAGVGR